MSATDEARDIRLAEALIEFFNERGQPRQVWRIMAHSWEEAMRDLLRSGQEEIKRGPQ